MKRLTHFIPKTINELDKIYRDNSSQIDLDFNDFKKAFRKNAKAVACLRSGRIFPVKEVDEESKEVDKYYNLINKPVTNTTGLQQETMNKENNPKTDENVTTVSSESANTTSTVDDRRKRIDDILSVVNFNIDSDSLTRIINIIDFDNKHGDNATYGKIKTL